MTELLKDSQLENVVGGKSEVVIIYFDDIEYIPNPPTPVPPEELPNVPVFGWKGGHFTWEKGIITSYDECLRK